MNHSHSSADTISDGFIDRLKTRVDVKANQAKHSNWVQKYTYIEGEKFNFKDHEMQQAIFDDPASRIVVKKCSQVGLSELQVRKLLTIAAVMKHVRVIYTLPTRQMSMKFSKDRIDGVIKSSPHIHQLLVRGSDSSEQKVFSNGNVLYVNGTFGDVSAISVPATYIVNDELDFSNMNVVSKMSSRLRHAKLNADGERGYHYMFSTPTLPGYGVSKAFDTSDQKYYACKCTRCNHWNIPHWFTHFDIPGYHGDMREFTAEMAEPIIAKSLHHKAKILCEKCGTDLWPALIDKSRREWVAQYPGRVVSGYQVSPWDVPQYNHPHEVLSQMSRYTRHMDFMNFVLGLEYQDTDAVFAEEPFTKCNNTRFITPDTANSEDPWVSEGLVAGMDVGKICHFIVGKPTLDGIKVVYAEEVRHTQQTPADARIKHLLTSFGTRFFVMDSGPDITLVRHLMAFCQANGINGFASEYTDRTGLENFIPKADTQVVKVNRTECFKTVMRQHNTFCIDYPSEGTAEVMTAVRAQVKNLKKITRELDSGEVVEQFVKTGPDHFGHSLNYLGVAASMSRGGGVKSTGHIPILPGIKGIKLKDGFESEFNPDPFARLR